MALLILIAMLFCSCDEWAYDSDEGDYQDNMVTSSGGVVTAFNGSVTLTFPKEAINSDVQFTVKVCLQENACDFLLRPISIEPVILFNKPVNVTLKYDGDLATIPLEIYENSYVMATLWGSEEDYRNHQSCLSCVCDVDNAANTFTFCIGQTGIITIEGTPDEFHN